MLAPFIFALISFFKGKTLLPTLRINENIFTVQCGYVNFYIYSKNNKYICFDAGFNKKNIYKEFVKININPNSISKIFLTHSDYDHYNGMQVFSNSIVYISNEEKVMINRGVHRLFGLNRKSHVLTKMEELQDGQIINYEDIKIECILTPGHTYGSMSYLVDNKYLFLGDACRIINNEIKPLKKYINMNTVMQIKSIEKIKQIENVLMSFVSHTGYKIGV